MEYRVWEKVSIHAGVLAGVTTAVAFYSPLLAFVLGGGTLAVSWARSVTQRDTMIQVVLGWAIAVVCVVTVFYSTVTLE